MFQMKWSDTMCRILFLLFFSLQLLAFDEIIEFPCNIERIMLTEGIIPTLPVGDRPLIYFRYGCKSFADWLTHSLLFSSFTQ